MIFLSRFSHFCCTLHSCFLFQLFQFVMLDMHKFWQLITLSLRLTFFCSHIRGLHHVRPQILLPKQSVVWVDFRHFEFWNVGHNTFTPSPSTTKFMILFIALVLRWTWPNIHSHIRGLVEYRSCRCFHELSMISPLMLAKAIAVGISPMQFLYV